MSAGTVNITDEAHQTQDIAGLSRDTTNTNGTVANTPDVNNILNQQADTMQAAQAAGQVIAQGIGAYADMKHDLAVATGDKATADAWGEGGTDRVLAHIVGGALIGGVGGGSIGMAAAGAAGEGVSAALAGKLNGLADQIGDATGSMTLGNVVSNVLAGAGGALVGGTAGAFTASNADLYNRGTGNAEGKGGTGSQVLDWIGDQLASAGRGAQNLADQFAALVNTNGPQGSYVDPDDLSGPGGNSKPPAAGGSSVAVAVCVPPLCAVVPAVTPGAPGYGAGNATFAKGDNGTQANSTDNGGAPPPNMSPDGAGRSGAFNEAKRNAGIPVSQQPVEVRPNVDRQGNVQPGYQYVYEVPSEGGGTKEVIIRDDAGGHFFGENDSQNRGAHFNDPAGNHYDY